MCKTRCDSCILTSEKYNELTSSYLRNPAKLKSIIQRSLTTSKSAECLKVSQMFTSVWVDTGSFLSVFLGATLFEDSSMDVTKVLEVGSLSPFISRAHFIP